MESAVVVDAIAAHERVFGVLTLEDQQTLQHLLRRVVEQGAGHKVVVEPVDL